MAFTQPSDPQDVKGKGKMNESTIIKQEVEGNSQVGLHR